MFVYQRIYDWLVVTGCHEFGIFPFINWVSIIIPTDEVVYFSGRGGEKPPTRCGFIVDKLWNIYGDLQLFKVVSILMGYPQKMDGSTTGVFFGMKKMAHFF